jgi:hypothetical protein
MLMLLNVMARYPDDAAMLERKIFLMLEQRRQRPNYAHRVYKN